MSGRQDSKAARRRPLQPRISEYDRGLVLTRLEDDVRYQRLSAMDQHVLALAVRKFMGGHGYWWHSRVKWAKAANVCTKTISRATDHFAAVGLVTKQPYLRPPGGNGGGLRGSCVYRLDPNIVGSKLLTVPAQRVTGQDTESRHVETSTGRDKESEHVEASPRSTGRDSEFPRGGPDRQGQTVPTELDLDRNYGNNNNCEPRGSHEPAGFTSLLEGIALRGKGRDFALARWLADPDLAEAQVDEWWERRPYSEPGLLVEMMRCGDDPRVVPHSLDGDSESIPF